MKWRPTNFLSRWWTQTWLASSCAFAYHPIVALPPLFLHRFAVSFTRTQRAFVPHPSLLPGRGCLPAACCCQPGTDCGVTQRPEDQVRRPLRPPRHVCLSTSALHGSGSHFQHHSLLMMCALSRASPSFFPLHFERRH